MSSRPKHGLDLIIVSWRTCSGSSSRRSFPPRQVKALATEKPFGVIAAGHTHFALLSLTRHTATEKKAVEALPNHHDEVVRGRDVHRPIRSRSTATTLESRQWSQGMPDNPTMARKTTMLERLAERL
jgi:hypothetical protein